jgi:hypothetical protein
MVERLVLEVGKIELIGHQTRREVMGKRCVTADWRQRSRAASLIRWCVRLADAEREL